MEAWWVSEPVDELRYVYGGEWVVMTTAIVAAAAIDKTQAATKE